MVISQTEILDLVINSNNNCRMQWQVPWKIIQKHQEFWCDAMAFTCGEILGRGLKPCKYETSATNSCTISNKKMECQFNLLNDFALWQRTKTCSSNLEILIYANSVLWNRAECYDYLFEIWCANEACGFRSNCHSDLLWGCLYFKSARGRTSAEWQLGLYLTDWDYCKGRILVFCFEHQSTFLLSWKRKWCHRGIS